MTSLDANPSMLWGRIIVDELVAAGLTHVCVSPGSRSTPLTLAAANHPELEVHSHIDERSSAFFALGCAKITGKPVALICTSGSAAAHYLPALVEACHARVPLIVLSADRPVELMDTGAGQTIDQKGMFAHHVKLFEHLETPNLLPQALRRLRATMQRVYARSLGQPGTSAAPGPVHVNVPFREPLEPTPSASKEIEALTSRHPEVVYGRKGGWVSHSLTGCAPTEAIMTRLVSACAKASRGMIVCGPLEPIHHDLCEHLVELLDITGFPLMADPLSSVRHGPLHPSEVSAYDAFLRARDVTATADYKPDLIIRFGAQPTSKSYRFWREAHPNIEEILIDPFGQAFDHPQLAGQVIYADPIQCIENLCKSLRSIGYLFSESSMSQREVWMRRWQTLNSIAIKVLRAAIKPSTALWEGQIAHDVVQCTDDRATIFLASSMPIRDVDAFSHPRSDEQRHLIANRGANGIDGLIATAAGVSSAQRRRCVLLIGDVAFLHDASSLLTALRGVSPSAPVCLDIVVVNNAGGGIFSYLPVANFPEHFERHFITPHSVDIESLCRAYGASYARATTPAEWSEGCARIGQGLPDGERVRVTEVVVDREDNVEVHRQVWAQIVDMIAKKTGRERSRSTDTQSEE